MAAPAESYAARCELAAERQGTGQPSSSYAVRTERLVAAAETTSAAPQPAVVAAEDVDLQLAEPAAPPAAAGVSGHGRLVGVFGVQKFWQQPPRATKAMVAAQAAPAGPQPVAAPAAKQPDAPKQRGGLRHLLSRQPQGRPAAAKPSPAGMAGPTLDEAAATAAQRAFEQRPAPVGLEVPTRGGGQPSARRAAH